jgi:hypothetical protein
MIEGHDEASATGMEDAAEANVFSVTGHKGYLR